MEAALAKAKADTAADHEKVVAAGGLHIIGTERHESRRIDNQLRGRAGRQGDPGSSRFYVSLEDELMRLFGSERISNLMDRFNIEEDVPIEHPWITKAIENAQTKVESHHFDIRKNVKEYDDVMNEQRRIIYADRRKILEGQDIQKVVWEMDTLAMNDAAYLILMWPEFYHVRWDFVKGWTLTPNLWSTNARMDTVWLDLPDLPHAR